MMEALYLASGFAFLVFFEKPHSFLASQTRQVFFSLIQQSAVIFFTLLLLLILEKGLEKIILSPYPGEEMIPLLMLAAYAATRLLKKESAFFFTLLAFGFLLLTPQAGVDFPEKARQLVMVIAIFTFTRFALEGLRFRLLFASPPKRLAGMPAVIFAFAIFLMLFSALKAIAG